MIQQQLKTLYDQAVEGWSNADLAKLGSEAAKTGAEAARTGASTLLDSIRNNPKTTAAVILGTGLAAAALWVLREPQRLAALKRGLTERARELSGARRSRAPRERDRARLP